MNDGWVTVDVFPHRGLAEVAASALRAEGMLYRLIADDLGGTTGLPLGGAYQGVEVQVLESDAARSASILQVEKRSSSRGWDPTRLTWQRVVATLLLLALLAAVVATQIT